MAAGNRNVNYNFTSSTKGLNTGVAESLALLDKLSAKTKSVQATSADGKLTPSIARLNAALAESKELFDRLKSQLAVIGSMKGLHKEALLMNEQTNILQDLTNMFSLYAANGTAGITTIVKGLQKANYEATQLMSSLRYVAESNPKNYVQVTQEGTKANAAAKKKTRGISSQATKDLLNYETSKRNAQVKAAPTIPKSNEVIIEYKANITGLRQGASEAKRILKDMMSNESLKSTLEPILAQVNTLQTILRNSDPKVLKDIPIASQQAASAVTTLLQIQRELGSATTVSTSDEARFKASLDAVSASMTKATQEAQKAILVSRGKTQSEKDGIAAAFEEARATSQVAPIVNQDTAVKEKNTEKTKETSKAVKDHSKALDTVGRSMQSALSAIAGMTHSMSKLVDTTKLAQTAGLSLQKVFYMLSGITAGMFAESVLKQSVDYVEILELFRVATQGARKEAQAFVNSMEDVYGMDPNSIMKATGTFFELTGAIGMPIVASSKLSIGLTKAAVDLSSLFNRDIESVVQDITSGMLGMTRAVRKYGIDLRMVTLEATAASLGIHKQAESMTEADRQGLRYLTIMNQTSSSAGNFAKTIESVANQLRILKEQTLGVLRAIGNLFMPIMQKFIYVLNGVAMALKTVLSFIGAFAMSFKPQFFDAPATAADEESNAIKGVGDEADKAAKKLNNLAGFDELNILQKPSVSATAIAGDEIMSPEIMKAMEEAAVRMESFKMKATELKEELLGFLGFTGNLNFKFNFDTNEWDKNVSWVKDNLENNLINKFPQWKLTIVSLFSNWDAISASFSRLWTSIKDSFMLLISPLKLVFGDIFSDANMSTFIAGLPAMIDSIIAFFKPLVDAFTRLGTAMAPFAGPILKGLLDLLGSLATLAQGTIITFLDGFSTAIENIPTGNATLISSLFTLLKGGLEGVTAAAPGFIEGLFGIVSTIVSEIGNQLPTLIPAIVELALTLVKALYDNLPLLTNAAWDLVEGLVNGLIDSLPLIVEMAPQIVSSMVTGAINAISRLVEAATAIIKALVTYFSNPHNQATLLASVISILKSIIGYIQDGVYLLVQGALAIIKSLTGYFANAANRRMLLTSMTDILKVIVDGLVSSIDLLVTSAQLIIEALIDFLLAPGMIDLLINMAFEIIEVIITGLSRSIPTLITAARPIFDKLIDALKKLDWINIGSSIISGVLSGIASGIGGLISSVKATFGNVLTTVKDFLGIKSPSKVFSKEVGENISLGIAEGILKSSSDVINSAIKVADNVKGSFKDIAPTIQADIDKGFIKSSNMFVGKIGAPDINIEDDSNANLASQIASAISNTINNGSLSTTLQRLLTVTQEGKVIAVDKKVLGRVVQQALNTDFRSSGYTTVEV